jgi:DNA-binding MarR family transcriptional regulator
VGGDEHGLHDEDYRDLLAFRTALREFLHVSDRLAGQSGVAPAQHQLLLAIRGFPDGRGPTITDVSRQLFVRHHSAVELVKRAVASGLVRPAGDPVDRRLVRLRLTARGRRQLAELTLNHLPDMRRLERVLRDLWECPRVTSTRPRRPDRAVAPGLTRARGGSSAAVDPMRPSDG